MKLEIVKIEHYHSIIADGKLVLRDSCEDLVNDLAEVFQGKDLAAGVSIHNKVFDDDELDEYEAYLDLHR